MDATPIIFDTATPVHGARRSSSGAHSPDWDAQWAALHAVAATVAALAVCPEEPMSEAVRRFPQVMTGLHGLRRNVAEQGVDDLVAILEPGLSALLAVHAAGADPVPAARALWQEFGAARDALLVLASPIGAATR